MLGLALLPPPPPSMLALVVVVVVDVEPIQAQVLSSSPSTSDQPTTFIHALSTLLWARQRRLDAVGKVLRVSLVIRVVQCRPGAVGSLN
ncbi:hypothetical protein C8R43DRAFT_1133690 [Mycena crocata]|nr:hypothetical protein C8R43DRAFT_1133690 [Mycena crocata]